MFPNSDKISVLNFPPKYVFYPGSESPPVLVYHLKYKTL